MFRHHFFISIFIILGTIISSIGYASSFVVPLNGNALIGSLQSTSVSGADLPALIAQRYNVGLNAIIAANPGTTEETFGSHSVKIPTEFLLPSLPQKGIIINLPEMRMYYYPDDRTRVMTFPVGIGKVGRTIPIQNTVIVRKVVNPVWTPTPAIRKFNREQGIDLPYRMEAGPDNPLGPYAIYLRIPTYLIHSTIFPESIGRRASFGCIRMHEDDIKEFFPLVKPGTPVAIINMPDKIGWNDNRLYLEAHPALEEHSEAHQTTLNEVVSTIENALPRQGAVLVDWQLASYILDAPDGVPHEIGMRIHL